MPEPAGAVIVPCADVALGASAPVRTVRDAVERARGATAQPSSASCWYAVDWKDMRCSGETPIRRMASRCSGVE